MNTAAWVVPGFVYFVVLIAVVLEPHKPARRGRHRRDRAEGAR